ncbi:MAG: hypothetical protein L0210_04570 [Rhodospirillales bacterium]|nr:hypothetical protein [Rhodospirillales bacterium]
MYRLIKTSLPDDLLDGLVGKDGRSLAYRGLLTHLAIVSGAPTIAHSYFQHLQSDRGRPETLAALREGLAAESWISESPEWLNIDGALRRIEALNAKAQLSVEGEMVEVMRELAPVAMRYSFTAQPHL